MANGFSSPSSEARLSCGSLAFFEGDVKNHCCFEGLAKMDTCDIKNCNQSVSPGIVYGNKTICIPCWLRHYSDADPFNLKTPGIWEDGPVIFTRRATATAVVAVEPAAALF